MNSKAPEGGRRVCATDVERTHEAGEGGNAAVPATQREESSGGGRGTISEKHGSHCWVYPQTTVQECIRVAALACNVVVLCSSVAHSLALNKMTQRVVDGGGGSASFLDSQKSGILFLLFFQFILIFFNILFFIFILNRNIKIKIE